MVRQEWKELVHNTWFKIVMIAIIIIPCVYAGVFLGSMWDPYGNSGSIPVAIVNEDKQVVYNEQSLNVGEELVKNLMDNDSMDFHFVSQQDASDGLTDGSYYMIITIPSDFSKNATTLLDRNPQKMILNYTTNPGTNYIASKMDDSAIAKIKSEVSTSVTKTYAKTIFEQIKTLSSGLGDAVKGTEKLGDGVNQLSDGSQLLSNSLKTLSTSSFLFQDGSNVLTQGLKDYLDGSVTVHNGVYSLKNGLDQLNSSTTSLSKGIQQLDAGSQSLTTGIKQYTQGVNQTYLGTKQLVDNEQNLTTGIKTLSTTTQSLKDLNTQINKKMQDYNQHISENKVDEAKQDMQVIMSLQQKLTLITTNLNASINGGDAYVIDKNNQVTGSTTVSQDKTLIYGLSTYMGGVKQINNGLYQLNDKSSSLIDGSQQLSFGTNSLLKQSPTLINGINDLDKGANDLYKGTSQLIDNNSKLLNGSNALTSGALQISEGSQKLYAGSTTLDNGLKDAKTGVNTLNRSLDDGAKKSQIETNDETFSMLASPIETKHQEISVVENNGHAMAPYMMSVALYVACLAFALMYPLLKDVNNAKSGFQYWLSKSSIWFFISTVASLAMIGTLMIFNGFNPQQTIMIFIFAVVVSAAFMSLVTLLSITTGRIGEFLLLIFMVINLGGSAGTYPLETSSTLYKIIHPFVPFTYSVNGFRKVISQTTASINQELFIFIGIIIVCSILTIIFYNYRIKKPTPLIPQAFEENQ
ncbi:MAG: YhgE/Pip domain-containing protein [Coprobacillus sp.]